MAAFTCENDGCVINVVNLNEEQTRVFDLIEVL